MTQQQGLALVLFSGGYDRVHYALVMAAAAAATGAPVSLLVAGRALFALLPECGWHGLDAADDGSTPAERDRSIATRGIADFEELLGACAALGVSVTACEMGLVALGLAKDIRLRDDFPIAIGGVVGFLDRSAGSRTLFI